MRWIGLLGTPDPDNPPAWCFRASPDGDLPTCSFVNGSWHRTFEDGGLGPGDGGPGAGAAIGVFFLGLVVAVAVLVWKISVARRMARESGMNPDDATVMTVLTDDGFEATYLAANLRQQPTVPPAPAASVADRLRELDRLLAEGLITQEERDERRRAVIDGI